MPNRLRAKHTAAIVVHPWGIDDGQGWATPQAAGVADFSTVEKNKLAARHTREVIAPFLQRLRKHVALLMNSMMCTSDSTVRSIATTAEQNASRRISLLRPSHT